MIWNEEAMKQAVCYELSCWPWGGDYRPKTTARIAKSAEGLYIEMVCEEKDPRRVYTNMDDPVYRDSCMECFLSLDRTVGYLNLECNANGALYCAFGPDRAHRFLLAERGICRPQASVEIQDERWVVRFFVPEETLRALFPKGAQEPLCGNFYKCGDDTDVPHYASAFEIPLPQPDYHCPAYFQPLFVK